MGDPTYPQAAPRVWSVSRQNKKKEPSPRDLGIPALAVSLHTLSAKIKSKIRLQNLPSTQCLHHNNSFILSLTHINRIFRCMLCSSLLYLLWLPAYCLEEHHPFGVGFQVFFSYFNSSSERTNSRLNILNFGPIGFWKYSKTLGPSGMLGWNEIEIEVTWK